MKQTTISHPLKEAEKAIKTIKKIIPKLTEGERATLELMLDAEAQKGLAESMEDVKKGRVITLDELKKQ